MGGTIGLLIKKHNVKQLKIFLAFSGAFLLSITVLNLLPEVYSESGFRVGDQQVGFFILGGFLLQIFIDLFSKGVEHGHLHFHEIKKVPYGVFIALSLHALLEGMAVNTIQHDYMQRNLVFGIALHEIPAAFALIVILKVSAVRKSYLYTWLVVYALMVPMGSMLIEFIIQPSIMNVSHEMVIDFTRALLALIIGVFLHISTTILFENSDNHRMERFKFAAIIAGIGIALLAGGFHAH